MENNEVKPQLNLDPQQLKLSHSFNCPSRETSEHIVLKRHVHVREAKLVFCTDCGNILTTIE